MNVKSKFSLVVGFITLSVFFVIKLFILFDLITFRNWVNVAEILCAIILIPMFYLVYTQLEIQTKETIISKDYTSKLNDLLVEQSNNDLYYEGDLLNAAKVLTKAVSKTLDVDRVSVWLYNDNKDAFVLQQLYSRSDNVYETGLVLKKSEYKPYFNYLLSKPVMVVNDVSKHPATNCFAKAFNIPLGIKSILDIPIWYNGDVVGVISIESSEQREWIKEEIDFAQVLTSLYSFAYSVRMNNIVSKDLLDFEKFIDKSLLVVKTNPEGYITYVNKKFEEVSGWKLKEIKGKLYTVLTSSFQTKDFWENARKVIKLDRKLWINTITGVKKNGELYWVDAYAKGMFDSETGELYETIGIWYDITDVIKSIRELEKKNAYLEYAAKIIRHDMHSGINTYIPRGVSSIERRLDAETIVKYKLESPLRLLKEGLKHTQKVYKGVYDFTNLVKKDVELDTELLNIKDILYDYLNTTAYSDHVLLGDLPTIKINESLFCTAIDNLIRNGIKYNDSETKIVKIYMENDQLLIIEDNGRGMSQEDFNNLSTPYKRKLGQKESGTGLGLNICLAILNEHGFSVTCEKLTQGGTKIKIKIK